MTLPTVYRRTHDTQVAEAVNALVDAATDSHSSLMLAAHWLLYTWRSAPDAFEQDVRTRAVHRIVARMADAEHAAWCAWLALPPLDRPSIHTLSL